jgi:hypothetical protein
MSTTRTWKGVANFPLYNESRSWFARSKLPKNVVVKCLGSWTIPGKIYKKENPFSFMGKYHHHHNGEKCKV